MWKDRNGQKRDDIIKRHGDLELEQDKRLQHKMGIFQNATRTTAALILVVALAGAFGHDLVHAVTRPLIIYLFLLLIFAVAGKRSMAEMDTLDMVTLLIISEATQGALIGQHDGLGYALIVILTLVFCSTFMAWLKSRRPRIEQFLQGGPILLVDHGRLLRDRMRAAYVDEQDILSSARQAQGVERLDQIKYAILETSGQISIIKAT